MSNEYGNIIYLLMLLVLVGGGFFATGKGTQNIRYLLIWAGVILVLVLGYQFYERQKFTPSELADGGYSLVIPFDAQAGGFRIQFEANGERIDGIIDTGATQFVLAYEDAEKAGIDPTKLRYNNEVSTANGRTQVAASTIDKINFGSIFYENVPVLVARQDDLEVSLVGMSMLRRFEEFGARDDRFFIRF